MKIDRVAVEITHADGQTDVIKPIDAFSNFAEALKKFSTIHTKYRHWTLT